MTTTFKVPAYSDIWDNSTFDELWNEWHVRRGWLYTLTLNEVDRRWEWLNTAAKLNDRVIEFYDEADAVAYKLRFR